MSVLLTVEVNGIDKQLKPDSEVLSIVNLMLINVFFKQFGDEALVRSEKMILYFLLKGIPFQCIGINIEQYEAFKEAAKRLSVSYHPLEHPILKKRVCLFYREADAVSVNEIIKNTGIRIIKNFGLIQSEDPNYLQHSKAARHFLNGDKLLDVYGLFDDYTSNGGSLEDCKKYLIALVSGPVLEDMKNSNLLEGICFKGFVMDLNDSELKGLNPESTGGHGTTNYFEKLRLLNLEATKNTKSSR